MRSECNNMRSECNNMCSEYNAQALVIIDII